VDPVGPCGRVTVIAWRENVRVAVGSKLVWIAEDSHENVKVRFGDSMSVMAAHKYDVLYGLGLVGVHEGRFLAMVARD